jgi:hypothetical protein
MEKRRNPVSLAYFAPFEVSQLLRGAALQLTLLFFVAGWLVGCNKKKFDPKTDYVITEHRVIPASGLNVQRDGYIVHHGDAVLTVMYYESQSYDAPFNPPNSMERILEKPKVLHLHRYAGTGADAPDLSQVPQVGAQILQCVIDKREPRSDDVVISIQPTPDPCMIRNGKMLHYEQQPNAARGTYVKFEIVSEREGKE